MLRSILNESKQLEAKIQIDQFNSSGILSILFELLPNEA